MSIFALDKDKKFPLNTISDVKKAEQYFVENEKEIPIDVRREYCKNVYGQMNVFGLTPHEKIAAYAGNIDKDKFKLFLKSREPFIEKTAGEGLLTALTRVGDLDEALRMMIAFDRNNGIDNLWDSSLPNPILGVTTAPAAPIFDIIHKNGDRATMGQIERLKFRRERMHGVFSDSFIDSFMENPRAAINTLNDAEQTLLIRMAREELL